MSRKLKKLLTLPLDDTSALELKRCYCSSCARFLGYMYLESGIVKLLCPKCKNWTDFIEFENLNT